MSWTLCIDFGTAYSKAAATPSSSWMSFDPGLVRPLMLGGAGGDTFLLDSAVFVDDERILFGAAAVARGEALAASKRTALRSFKTILGAGDLERALNNNAPRPVDPSGMFQLRDLIVLYLAYLSAAIEQAVAADPVLAKVEAFERRYAAPVWRSAGAGASDHEIIARLFGEADAVRGVLGKALLSPQGVLLDTVRKALTLANRSKAPSSGELGLIFEATAAAAYTSIGLENPASHLIVLDMGAGTTDVAAVIRSKGALTELPAARVTLKEAGDTIDRIIANMALAQCRHLKSPEAQTQLWRAMMHSMRHIKESMFADGRAVFRFEGRMLKFALRDMEREADFKAFLASLTGAYDEGLAALCEAALADGVRELQSIAVGGGAFAPFVQALIQKRPRSGKLRITPRAATPRWAADAYKGNLAPVFPQLAIAIGGALAPSSMLAARALNSPAARTDT